MPVPHLSRHAAQRCATLGVPPSLPLDVLARPDHTQTANGPASPRPLPAHLSPTSGAAGRRARADASPVHHGPEAFATSHAHPGWVILFNPETLTILDLTNTPTLTRRAAKECARLGITEDVPLAIMAARTVVQGWYGRDGRPLAKAIADAHPGYAVVYNPATLRVILVVPADADLSELDAPPRDA